MIPFQIQVEKTGGDNLLFTPSALSELSYVQSVSFDGDTVQSDELSAAIRQNDPDWLTQWEGVNRNSPVWLIRSEPDSRVEKFYFKSIRRIAKYDFRLTAQSPLGRLTSDFPGGLYNGVSLSDVISAVVGTIVPYSVNPLLASVRVYGWTPYQSRRETLHALAFAYGFLIRRNENQDLYFTVPDTNAYNIPDNALFTGGSVAYRIGETYARAEITACDYLKIDTAEQTLFDNTDATPVDNLIVKFDGPMFDIAASDELTIHDSGVNYAVVSGVGALTGKPYSKFTSVVSVDGDPAADSEQVLSVTDAPLITSLNAVSVGERLLNYNNAPAVVSTDILRTFQRTGDYVSFTDPFGDVRSGYITSLSGSITSFDRASASILCGYSPTWGAAYDAVSVLTGSGTWTVPEYLDGDKLRIVLIGGGTGGNSGQHGTDSNALGCGSGLPGEGGKILEVKITVSAGQIFEYSAGQGGAGGIYTSDTSNTRPENMTVYVTRTGDRWHLNPSCNGGTYTRTTLKQALAKHLTPCETCVRASSAYYVSNAGSPGTPSVFGDFSSDSGKTAKFGFYDAIDDIRYALPGPDNGVDGGAATSGTENGDRNNPAYTDVEHAVVSLPWDSSQNWTSGDVGEGQHFRSTDTEGVVTEEWAYGGLGGGAAVGCDGNSGWNASESFHGGNGGKGADASPIFPATPLPYGTGGSGGHGGGEGGSGGSGHSNIWDSINGESGSGGAGVSGQSGADGCILIYFKKPNQYQYSFTVRDGRLVLTYYTAAPPAFAVNQSHHLTYTYSDSDTPPTFEIKNKHLYLSE